MSFLQWTAIAIVCTGLEIASSGFWFMWLGIAAFAVALLSLTGLITGLVMQFIIFAGISLVLIIFTRPLLMRLIKVRDTHSNTDALIGKLAVVTQPITPLEAGQVKVNGEIWSAVSEEELDAGEKVRIVAVTGVKLQVEPTSALPSA